MEKKTHRTNIEEFYPPSQKLSELLFNSPYKDQIIGYVRRNGGSVFRDLLQWPKEKGSVLTDLGILRHMLAGNIKIEPFNPSQLESIGYSLRVSNTFFRRKTLDELNRHNAALAQWMDGTPIYDAYNPEYINIVWNGPLTPTSASEILQDFEIARHAAIAFDRMALRNNPLATLEGDEELIFIHPNEMILGCTEEAIGGCNVVTTIIAGKSSVGRHGYEVCSDAFLGEPGFIYPWALEIVNKHPDTVIYLKKSTLVATMVFQELTELPLKQYEGNYIRQGQSDPRSLLPKPLRK